MARREPKNETPVPCGTATGVGYRDCQPRHDDTLSTLRVQRLERCGVSPQTAAVLAPVAFGGRRHG